MQYDPFQPSGESCLRLEPMEAKTAGLIARFTTRHGGQGRPPYDTFNLGLHVGDRDRTVLMNRQHLADLVSVPLNHWVMMEQVHGANIKKVTKEDIGKGIRSIDTSIPQVDGLYTADAHVMLGALYADCVPLYLLEPRKGLIGIAHAGWRGTSLNIGGRMIRQWIDDEHSTPSEIYAAVGPAIGFHNYEVDDKVIQAIQTLNVPLDNVYHTKPNGHYQLDLQELNRLLLIEQGLKETNVFKTSYNTAETNRFFSHRVEGQTGRMMGFIGKWTS